MNTYTMGKNESKMSVRAINKVIDSVQIVFNKKDYRIHEYHVIISFSDEKKDNNKEKKENDKMDEDTDNNTKLIAKIEVGHFHTYCNVTDEYKELPKELQESLDKQHEMWKKKALDMACGRDD